MSAFRQGLPAWSHREAIIDMVRHHQVRFLCVCVYVCFFLCFVRIFVSQRICTGYVFCVFYFGFYSFLYFPLPCCLLFLSFVMCFVVVVVVVAVVVVVVVVLVVVVVAVAVVVFNGFTQYVTVWW